jgi:6-phosphogluconate dehydrogenase
MSDQPFQIAVVGMGVMGLSLARNLHSRGTRVLGFDRKPPAAAALTAAWGDDRFAFTSSYAALAAQLERPRRVLLMVTAGAAVDAVIASLRPHLEPGDVIIDGGNSHWPDTDRRERELAAAGLHFVGMGVSGGEEGALRGPSMMPGGSRASWEALRPLLEPAAAVSDTGPCVAWCGHRSAGHAVKMVHNGIEYGDMQLIAEVWSLLRPGRSPGEVAAVFGRWNAGRLESYLVELTAQVVAARDPQGDGPLVDQILDVAGQKGTGRWTVIDAVEAGVAMPTVAAAVDGRVLSARKADRQRAAALFDHAPDAPNVREADLEAALYAAKLCSYSQGFDLLASASAARGYETDLAEIARIWKAGCIIRARFLDRVYDAFRRDPKLPLLLLDPGFAAELAAALPALRRVVGAAVAAGVPVPALSASVAWLDQLRQARGTASLIQAQRDNFGAHTYRRVDAPDVAVHTQWDELERLP